MRDGGVAIVTGGAKGIGPGIARRLADDGLAAAILDVDVEGAEETAKELPSGSAHPCDVSSYESVVEAVRGVLERWNGSTCW